MKKNTPKDLLELAVRLFDMAQHHPIESPRGTPH